MSLAPDAADVHFPHVHLRPRQNWVNDPNGLVHHDGWFHVFFQYNPFGPRHAHMHWGHARSTDLLHWEMLPTALAPSPDGVDSEGVWSGNAVSCPDRAVAFYAAKHPDRWYEPVAMATSVDGVAWDKRPGLVIAEPPEGVTMFRDPFVWLDGDRWRMLVGAALDDGRGAAVEYATASTDDLENWSYRGVFHAAPPTPLDGGVSTEEGWECAQFASFENGRAALLVSAWSPLEGASCAVAWPGQERDGRFETRAPERLDYGPDFYAPAVMSAPDGRTLMWAWIWEARDEARVGAPSAWTDKVGWAGMLSLPREISVTEAGVSQQPAAEIESLRREHRLQSGVGAADLGGIDRSADVVAQLEGAGGLRIVTSADEREHLDILLDPEAGEVVVDRECASLDPRAKGGRWSVPVAPGPVELRVVLDRSVVEVFVSGRALTARFYPVGSGGWRLTTVGEVRHHVDVWDLEPLQIIDHTVTPVEQERALDAHEVAAGD